MIVTTTPVKEALGVLLADAKARGMPDLQIVYGWSIIRINCEIIAQNDETLRRLRGKTLDFGQA